jgi:hypothetical protein
VLDFYTGFVPSPPAGRTSAKPNLGISVFFERRAIRATLASLLFLSTDNQIGVITELEKNTHGDFLVNDIVLGD